MPTTAATVTATAPAVPGIPTATTTIAAPVDTTGLPPIPPPTRIGIPTNPRDNQPDQRHHHDHNHKSGHHERRLLPREGAEPEVDDQSTSVKGAGRNCLHRLPFTESVRPVPV